jgi:phenylalanyl-tRNA synthetase alpha chain
MTQMFWEIEEIFSAMGFEVIDGREVESEYNNFEALNIPSHHPARDMQDTFFLNAPEHTVLRTHTSNFQVKTMKQRGVPLRAVSFGRVFRNEAIDASHENTFYQLEGLMVDEGISVSHLIGVMKTFLRAILKREVKVRLRPGYFPFVEPGFELDMNCAHCQEGCRVCKYTGWIEMLGCGMVHPNVLREGQVDMKRYSGFAFGIGLNRLIMNRYNIDDIRHFLSGDVRFLQQF